VTPILISDSAGSLTVYLETTAGAPATGLTDTDVTADLRKEGAGSFSSHTLTPSNFTELGGGFYEIDVAAADTSALGNLYLRIQGGTIKTTLAVSFVVDSDPINPPTITPPSIVAIFGYIYGPDAEPVVGVGVTARILGSPTVLHPGNEGLAIGQELVTSATDSDGFFTINLISGTSVDLFISAARFRRTFVVPSSSANLFDIP
jgi:hypothetical protein